MFQPKLGAQGKKQELASDAHDEWAQYLRGRTSGGKGVSESEYWIGEGAGCGSIDDGMTGRL